MGTKHTPGPWKIADSLQALSGGGVTMGAEATVYAPYGPSAPRQTIAVAPNVYSRADAHLIAAAPDMLDVLTALEWSDTDILNEGRVCPACEAYAEDGHYSGCPLGAAITKATGGSTE